MAGPGSWASPAGILLWTAASGATAASAIIDPFGNVAGALLAFFLFGQMPGYLSARFLNYLGVLRLPVEVELAGADLLSDLEVFRALQAAGREELRALRNVFDQDDGGGGPPFPQSDPPGLEWELEHGLTEDALSLEWPGTKSGSSEHWHW